VYLKTTSVLLRGKIQPALEKKARVSCSAHAIVVCTNLCRDVEFTARRNFYICFISYPL